MRRLFRPDLSQEATNVLKERQRTLDLKLASLTSGKQSSCIKRHWENARSAIPLRNEHTKTNRPPDEVIQKLVELNRTSVYCMWCNDERAREIDHFHPKSLYPEQTFTWTNFIYACTKCNQSRSNQDPTEAKLLDPTQDALLWSMRLSLTTGQYKGLNAQGKATLTALGLNDGAQPRNRLNAVTEFRALVGAFFMHRQEKKHEEADDDLRAIQDLRHQTLYEELYLLFWEDDIGLDPEIAGAFKQHPELRPPHLTELVLNHLLAGRARADGA